MRGALAGALARRSAESWKEGEDKDRSWKPVKNLASFPEVTLSLGQMFCRQVTSSDLQFKKDDLEACGKQIDEGVTARRWFQYSSRQ